MCHISAFWWHMLDLWNFVLLPQTWIICDFFHPIVCLDIINSSEGDNEGWCKKKRFTSSGYQLYWWKHHQPGLIIRMLFKPSFMHAWFMKPQKDVYQKTLAPDWKLSWLASHSWPLVVTQCDIGIFWASHFHTDWTMGEITHWRQQVITLGR